MITSRSPKRSIARALRCSSQSCATSSSSRLCSAAKEASYPSASFRITRSRRSETSSISSLMSVNVRMAMKTPDTRVVFLRISELVQPVLVHPEVVGELVEHGDSDLLCQLLRVGKRALERPPEDGDAVREVRVLLPEPEQLGVGRVLGLDDHRDVLERRGDRRRQLVERRPDGLVEVADGQACSVSAARALGPGAASSTLRIPGRNSAPSVSAAPATPAIASVPRAPTAAAAGPVSANDTGRRLIEISQSRLETRPSSAAGTCRCLTVDQTIVPAASSALKTRHASINWGMERPSA